MQTEEELEPTEPEPEELSDEIPRTRKKRTKAEKDKLLAQVTEVLLMGWPPREIWRYLTEKQKTEISMRTLERYIQEATEQIKTASQVEREYQIGRSIKRLDHLYSRDIMIQDFKAALAVVRELNALLGLYPAQPTQSIKADITSQGQSITFLVQRAEEDDTDQQDGEPAQETV